MNFEKRQIGQKIKYYREKAGYNQTEFANLLNIGNNTLSQYENGDRGINDDIKIKICNLLKIEPNLLFGN